MNPALDLTGDIDRLVPNEKNYVHNEKRAAGGNGINGARIIKKFQKSVLTTGFLGGAIGDEISRMLREEKIPEKFVKVRGDTRINITVQDQRTHLQTRLSFKGPQIERRDLGKLLALIEKGNPHLLVVGGTLPQGVSKGEFIKFLGELRSLKIPFWLDAPAEILREALSSRPGFIKPNLLEFQGMVEKNIYSVSHVAREAAKLLKFIPMVCVSSVEGGAVLVTSRGQWFGKAPKIKVKTGLGAGDSMVGAMAANFGNTSAPELLKWGLAAACATVAHGNQKWPLSLAQSFFRIIKITAI